MDKPPAPGPCGPWLSLLTISEIILLFGFRLHVTSAVVDIVVGEGLTGCIKLEVDRDMIIQVLFKIEDDLSIQC